MLQDYEDDCVTQPLDFNALEDGGPADLLANREDT